MADTRTTRPTRGLMSTASQRKVWTYEVVDWDELLAAAQEGSEVAIRCMILDDRAVRQYIKDGLRVLPGLRIYEKTSTTVR